MNIEVYVKRKISLSLLEQIIEKICHELKKSDSAVMTECVYTTTSLSLFIKNGGAYHFYWRRADNILDIYMGKEKWAVTYCDEFVYDYLFRRLYECLSHNAIIKVDKKTVCTNYVRIKIQENGRNIKY